MFELTIFLLFQVQKVQREVIETDLNFLGLIVLENRLKPETFPCIQALNEANIRVIMVTGKYYHEFKFGSYKII